METKRCSKCGEVKTLDAFSPQAGTRLGRAAQCKACRVSAAKQRYLENSEKFKERSRRWATENPEKANARNARQYFKNPEKTKKRVNRHREHLAPHYVASLLRLAIAELTPELFELKREQILTTRALRELKKVINEQSPG